MSVPGVSLAMPEPARPEPLRQVAALCWRLEAGRLRVLLVTSRETGRWVLPKGWPIPGLSDAEAAAREAWEEAGVHGAVVARGLGVYGYRKMLNGAGGIPCRVEVFPLKVTRLAHAFPERGQRRRHWFTPRRREGGRTRAQGAADRPCRLRGGGRGGLHPPAVGLDDKAWPQRMTR
jgi:8-oxo-dGTP pyrophosphatase MutT (NUDIX family)